MSAIAFGDCTGDSDLGVSCSRAQDALWDLKVKTRCSLDSAPEHSHTPIPREKQGIPQLTLGRPQNINIILSGRNLLWIEVEHIWFSVVNCLEILKYLLWKAYKWLSVDKLSSKNNFLWHINRLPSLLNQKPIHIRETLVIIDHFNYYACWPSFIKKQLWNGIPYEAIYN